jgi:small subunit ribosomal protein S6
VKDMRKYEVVFIFVPHLEEEARNQLFDRLKAIIGEDNILDVDEWGMRKLAYEINDLNEGYYIVVNFESTPETIEELDRICKISDNIMRHMIVRVDE